MRYADLILAGLDVTVISDAYTGCATIQGEIHQLESARALLQKDARFEVMTCLFNALALWRGNRLACKPLRHSLPHLLAPTAQAAERNQEYDVRKSKGFTGIINLFNGAGQGAELDGVAGTAWGIVNAVTEYYDHGNVARTDDARLHSAWFGKGDSIKSAAFDMAMSL